MAPKLSDFLVVSDIDGTLLRAGLPFPQKNIDTVKEFISKGGNFTICTGRGIHASRKIVERFGINIPSVHCNGGVIYDIPNERTLSELIVAPVARKATEIILDAFPSSGIELIVGDEIWAPKINKAIQNHLDSFELDYTVMPLADARDGWHKVLFADTVEVIDEMIEFVESTIKPDPMFAAIDFARTSPIYYELIPVGVNKGKAMLQLADIMGIDHANTVAIGDFYNDLPLLETAGITAVVGNAPGDLKAKADYVVAECLDGGVAELLHILMDKYS